MNPFQPDYNHLIDAAMNRMPKRMPLYDHGVDSSVMEKITGIEVGLRIDGTEDDLDAAHRRYADFFVTMGYDACPYELPMVAALIGGGALTKHEVGCIKTLSDFEAYPWAEIPDRYFQRFAPYFESLQRTLPPGMKAVGGVGFGLFECVQDLVGYMNLCLIKYDDPELYAGLFVKMGEVMQETWRRLLARYGEAFCVCRFGDDLGFNSQTLISEEDIRQHVIPVYRDVIARVHAHGKPFLLHSCGCIFGVMDELIAVSRIDAKHSNEDSIAPFQTWVERYGDRIGNFGGIDCDVLIRSSEADVKAVTKEIIRKARPHGGFAFGTGNSVPDYVPVEKYIAMNEAAREMRGETP